LILAPDIRVGEDFSTPGVAAVPGRAARGQRRAVPAIPAVPAAPGPAELEVLDLRPVPLAALAFIEGSASDVEEDSDESYAGP
jgi:hypothetical protein